MVQKVELVDSVQIPAEFVRFVIAQKPLERYEFITCPTY